MTGRADAEEKDGDPVKRDPGSLGSWVRAVGPTILVILGLEVLLRVGGFLWHDGSQYYLFYGFHGLVGRVGISPWSVNDGSHFKFPPNYVLQGAAGQGAETARTNSLGFRGSDFLPRKPPGTFRIIALGGSSTFGFHNADTETYPYLLQRLLRARYPDRNIEVINAGFPYYNTGSVLSLLRHELLEYEPDVLTLYAAYNDSGWPLEVSAAFRSAVWLQEHSMIYLVLKETVLTDQRMYAVLGLLQRWFPSAPDRAMVEGRAEGIAERYRANVQAIADLARRRGIALILIRQPVTAHPKNPAEYPSYQAEHEAVLRKLVEGEPLTNFEVQLLIHRRLIAELDAIARERDLPLVDNIAMVDRDRSRLTTWVHLTAEANLRLAEALAQAMVPYLEEREPAKEIGGRREEESGSPVSGER